MTPLQTLLIGFAGGLCAVGLFLSIGTALFLHWFRQAPFIEEEAYIASHLPQPSQETHS